MARIRVSQEIEQRLHGGGHAEGSMEIHGRATFEEIGESRARLTLDVDMPIDESMKDHIERSMRRSAGRIKELIEAET